MYTHTTLRLRDRLKQRNHLLGIFFNPSTYPIAVLPMAEALGFFILWGIPHCRISRLSYVGLTFMEMGSALVISAHSLVGACTLAHDEASFLNTPVL